ncbi:MAG TPA: YdeI/OmpD-associated family protein [Labilithrix sp.]|nr:YdeI/OmpD-associated family protein [Labilithrix sp.]
MASVHVDPNKVFEFEGDQRFYEWLRKHWDREQEVWIRIYKVKSGVRSITPAQAIDVALCWGWIDGIRKGLDDASFLQRYTPRGKKSVWSKINCANIERLTKAGRMQPPGLAHVAAAKADGRWDKAYSIANSEAPADLLAAIRADPKALAMYDALSSQNRFALTFRVLNMKTEAGRKKKITDFVEMLKQGKTIHPQGKIAVVRAPRKQRRAEPE